MVIGLTIAGTVSAEQQAGRGSLRRAAMAMNHSRGAIGLLRSLSYAEGYLLHPPQQVGQQAIAEYRRRSRMHRQVRVCLR